MFVLLQSSAYTMPRSLLNSARKEAGGTWKGTADPNCPKGHSIAPYNIRMNNKNCGELARGAATTWGLTGYQWAGEHCIRLRCLYLSFLLLLLLLVCFAFFFFFIFILLKLSLSQPVSSCTCTHSCVVLAAWWVKPQLALWHPTQGSKDWDNDRSDQSMWELICYKHCICIIAASHHFICSQCWFICSQGCSS